MRALVAWPCLLWFLSGCASLTTGAAQPIRLDTKSPQGELIIGAACTLSNEHGAVPAWSGGSVQVRRSSQDLEITCTHPSWPQAQGRAISRFNAGMAGNALFGGVVGAFVDHQKGSAYTYPTWMQLVFGRTLVFDRDAEQDGRPAVGAEPARADAASAPAAPASAAP